MDIHIKQTNEKAERWIELGRLVRNHGTQGMINY